MLIKYAVVTMLILLGTDDSKEQMNASMHSKMEAPSSNIIIVL